MATTIDSLKGKRFLTQTAINEGRVYRCEGWLRNGLDLNIKYTVDGEHHATYSMVFRESDILFYGDADYVHHVLEILQSYREADCAALIGYQSEIYHETAVA